VLRGVEDVVGQLELQRGGEVLDRRDVGEDLGDALLDEVVEGLALDGDQVRELEDLRETGERESFAGRETRQGDSSGVAARGENEQKRSGVATGGHG
jgi:hypothetical protein